jgi:hypothetical protein
MKETEDDPPQIWHFATGARAKKMERVRKKMFNSDRGAGLHFACIYRLACVWPSPRFSLLAERRPGSVGLHSACKSWPPTTPGSGFSRFRQIPVRRSVIPR